MIYQIRGPSGSVSSWILWKTRTGALVAHEWVKEAMRLSYAKAYKAGYKDGQRDTLEGHSPQALPHKESEGKDMEIIFFGPHGTARDVLMPPLVSQLGIETRYFELSDFSVTSHDWFLRHDDRVVVVDTSEGADDVEVVGAVKVNTGALIVLIRKAKHLDEIAARIVLETHVRIDKVISITPDTQNKFADWFLEEVGKRAASRPDHWAHLRPTAHTGTLHMSASGAAAIHGFAAGVFGAFVRDSRMELTLAEDITPGEIASILNDLSVLHRVLAGNDLSEPTIQVGQTRSTLAR